MRINILKLLSSVVFIFIAPAAIFAQVDLNRNFPPSHDPSTMIQNVDGRYWIFTTGDGIWAMSSSTPDFFDWRPEATPYTRTDFPNWIQNYVTNFGGFFWAPDVIKIGNTYYLYYSCAGDGAPAAIGLATATNLSGPWTDMGMIYAGNNAIDPIILQDDDGSLWMAWGNWQEGIDILELNPATGLRMNNTKTKLINDNVEGPGLLKNGDYYYLFYQEGLCCNGLNSGYEIWVCRSTNITGPYSGHRVFYPNHDGTRVHGLGHVGYRYGRFTCHFYDVNDNGAPKCLIRDDFGYANGWPTFGITLDSDCNGDQGGTAYTDNCERCVGGNTERVECNTIQLENACSYDGTIDNDNEGFSGTGFLNFTYAIGSQMSIKIEALATGIQTLQIKYANGSNENRTCQVLHNNVEIITSLDFPTTGSWTTWDTISLTLNFNRGINQISFISLTETGGANLDQFIVNPSITIADCSENITIAQNRSIQMRTGWNLVGYPFDGEREISLALSGIWEYVETVKDDEGFYTQNQDDFLNSLLTLKRGHGYLVYVNEDCELIWIE